LLVLSVIINDYQLRTVEVHFCFIINDNPRLTLDKKNLQIAIGQRIRQLREERNIPQQDLAAACDFEKSNMARLEAGKTNPTLYTLKKIADNLNLPLEALVIDLL